MGLVAGVDVGNATTEIVVVDPATEPPTPVAWDRRPTVGGKGTLPASAAAHRLLRRIERRLGAAADLVVVTEQAAATTMATSTHGDTGDLGRLRLLSGPVTTPAGSGTGVGTPVSVDATPVLDRPVVLVAADPLGFRDTARRVRAWLDQGADVQALVLAGDEARLVAARVEATLPIVDQVSAEAALAAEVLLVEVADAPGGLGSAVDPVRLRALLRLDPADDASVRELTTRTRGRRAVVVARVGPDAPEVDRQAGLSGPAVRLTDDWVPLPQALTELREHPPGLARGLRLTDEVLPLDDLWGMSLQEVAAPAQLASDALGSEIVLAGLAEADSARAWPQAWPDRHVVIGVSETEAALAGARTTPGSRPDDWVLDLGGGTLDLVAPGIVTRVSAGAGDLLTAGVACLLDISRGTAEWVKRGPAHRVEGPHLLVDEAGGREFTDRPAAPGAVGWLAAPGPAGDLPFHDRLTPAEWRVLRRRLKTAVFVDNVARSLTVGAGVADRLSDRTVLLAGGPAEDGELLGLLRDRFPTVTFGRADIAGRLGRRWAVAYGLTLNR